MDPSRPPPITLLLREWSRGSPTARDELIPLVYHELRTLSRRMLRREGRDRLTSTALVHELFLKLTNYTAPQWNDRAHFFSFCARLMRQILIDQARERLAGKRSAILVPLGAAEVPWICKEPAETIDVDRAIDCLMAEEPEKARVVELRIYLGCTAEETAEILDISKATVDRHLAFARAFLFRSLGRGGK